MDGTLYHGDRPIPGAREFINGLRERDIPFRFVTNNSSHPRGFYADRLKRLGFNITEGDVLTSTIATIRFILDRRPGKSVYVIATPDVTREIADAGVPLAAEGTVPDIVLLTFDTTIDYLVGYSDQRYKVDHLTEERLTPREARLLAGLRALPEEKRQCVEQVVRLFSEEKEA
jgi:HAD superfamily hydrolase (TIGR01450 family)